MYQRASAVAPMVKNSPAMWDTWVQKIPWKRNATHSSILAWRIPMDRGAWWAAVHWDAKSQTRLSDFHFHVPVIVFLILCAVLCLVSQLCPTLCDPMDC